jgi:hypothetical protein
MTIRAVVALIATLALSASARAWSPYNAEVEGRNAVSTDAHKKIDFLTPSSLSGVLGSPDCLASYEVRPSFKPTQQWCLVEDGSAYFISSRESRDADATAATPKDSARLKVELPSDLAILIREIWLNAILEARYPRFPLGGADGEDHYFGAMRYHSREILRAEVWSPSSNLPPLWMAKAGAEIFSYTRSKSSSADRLRAYLLALRQKLFAYYAKHGRH